MKEYEYIKQQFYVIYIVIIEKHLWVFLPVLVVCDLLKAAISAAATAVATRRVARMQANKHKHHREESFLENKWTLYS